MLPADRLLVAYALACIINKVSYAAIYAKTDTMYQKMRCKLSSSTIDAEEIETGNKLEGMFQGNQGLIQLFARKITINFKINGVSFTGKASNSEKTFGGDVTGKSVKFYDYDDAKNCYFYLDLDEIRMVELHEQLTLLVSFLYSHFATMFVEQSDVWQSLANEEKQTAKWINKLKEGIIANKVVVINAKQKIMELEVVIRYVDEILNNSKSGLITIDKTIETTSYINTRNINMKLFNCYAGNTDKATDLLFILNNRHNKHCEDIELYINDF